MIFENNETDSKNNYNSDEEEQREKNERAVAGDEKEGGNLRAGNSASYNK